MMEPREEVLRSLTSRLAWYTRRYVEAGVHAFGDLGGTSRQYPNHRHETTAAFLDAVTKRIVYLSLEGICHHLEQPSDTTTARIAAEPDA